MANDLNEKKVKKDGTTRGVWMTAFISFVLFFVFGIVVYVSYKNEQKRHIAIVENQKSSYTQLLTTRDSVINEWMLTFDEIEQNLNLIKQKEKIITVKSSDKEFSNDTKKMVLKDIVCLDSLLNQDKRKLTALTTQLKNSGVMIKGLQATVVKLNATIKQYETEMSDLNVLVAKKDTEIEQLGARVGAQQIDIAIKNDKIKVQTAELNKGFVVYGTYKDLKTKGVVSEKGGFLGIGKKKFLSDGLSDNTFTQVDITKVKTIPVNSKDVKFMTNHPKDSYEIVRDKYNNVTSIEIKDSAEFWKISKYAVVVTK